MATSKVGDVAARSVIERTLPVGADALLIELTDPAWVFALDAEVRRRWVSRADEGQPAAVRVRDVVPAARTLLLDGVEAPGRTYAELAAEISSWTLSPASASASEAVEVPVIFDGPDLEEVARLWDMTTADAVATVAGKEFRAAFCGFAPGFAYLAGLPPERAVPRRPTPRTRVPAGAFGLAGEYAGIYPRSSPGGWQLLGTAIDVVLWDEGRQPPALLTPGTLVRVVDTSRSRSET